MLYFKLKGHFLFSHCALFAGVPRLTHPGIFSLSPETSVCPQAHACLSCMLVKLNVYLINAGKSKQTDTFQGSRGVLFDRISSYIYRTIVARIYLLLIQITLRDRTANMRPRTLVAEVFVDFSLLLIKKNLWDQGRNRITRPIRLNGRQSKGDDSVRRTNRSAES